MSHNDIIRMAREAGFEHIAGADYWHPYFERFAALVAAAEREACANVVEADLSYDWNRFACEAAAATRAIVKAAAEFGRQA